MLKIKTGLVMVLMGFSSAGMAANIVVNYTDPAGSGFNDPNPPLNAQQKGNNPGNTLGELRKNVFQGAADQWAATLASTETITVDASWESKGCGSTFLLGQAGPTSTRADFGAGTAGTAYPIALAEALASSNLNGGSAEISASFNSDLDEGDASCNSGNGYYYGLDNNAPTGFPALFSTVLHELGHGLGFTSFTNDANGQFIGAGQFPDAFSRNLADKETGKSWAAMTDQERFNSARNDPDLVWSGARVTAERVNWLDFETEIRINAPGGIAGPIESNLSPKGSIVIPPSGVTADVIDGDAVQPITFDPNAGGGAGACVTNFPDAAIDGKFVLYDYSSDCPPDIMAVYADGFSVNQGITVAGLIIRNTQPAGLPDMSIVFSNPITFPYFGVTQATGDDLRANIATANVTVGFSDSEYVGENNGMVRMFAPATIQPGSSVSHFTGDARPDLLMEPGAGSAPFDQIDLTVPAYEDMGWLLIDENGALIFFDGFEGN